MSDGLAEYFGKIEILTNAIAVAAACNIATVFVDSESKNESGAVLPGKLSDTVIEQNPRSKSRILHTNSVLFYFKKMQEYFRQ